MCLPALAAASAAVAVIGQGISAYSAHGQAKYEAAVARQNSTLASNQALDAIKRGQIDDRRSQQETAKLIGSQQARLAANGIDVGYGNAADMIGDTATYGAEDAATIRENAMREAMGHDMSAMNFRAQARAARSRATGALVSGGFGIAQTALGGATQFAQLRAKGR